MNKLFTKIAIACTSAAMAVGVGVAVGLSSEKVNQVNAAAIAGTFEKITSVSSLSAGDTVIITNSAGTLALGDLSATSSGYGTTVSVTATNNKITLLASTTVTQFVVEAGKSSGYAFKAQNNTNLEGYYVSYNNSPTATSKNNYLGRYNANTASAKQSQFNVSYSSDHFVFQSVYASARWMRFNSDRFACYYSSGSESTQGTGVSIYKYQQPSQKVSPTSIACAAQSIDVLETVDLSSAVVFTPNNTTETGLSFGIKSGGSNIDLNTVTGVVTGKHSGNAVVTITPNDTSAGATAIDVNITVSAISAPGITIGNNYVVYANDPDNGNYELTGVVSNYGTAAAFSGSIPACSYVLSTENGYYENTVAFKNGSNYLALTADSGNLHTSAAINANSSWIVTWNSTTYEASITNAVYHNRQIRFNYNGGTTRFACYASTGSQIPVALYPYVEKALTDFTLPASIDVYKTGNATIEVTYTPADASDKTLNWSSANTAIATVADGVVTGVAVGQTTVTASKVISGSTVSRQCTINVLNNVSTHKGSLSDPFDINDAVNVAKGVMTKDCDNVAIDLVNNEYHVKGKITHCVTRTKTNVTLWLGDNDSQVTADTGAFELYKAGFIYSTAIASYYTADTQVTRDFNVGDYLLVKSKLTVYNGTPETVQNEADVLWNNYIDARVWAEGFNNSLGTGKGICTNDNTTDTTALSNAWTSQSSSYSSLDSTSKAVVLEATAKTTSSATDIEKCVAQYDWIVGRYELTDFIGRNPSSVGRVNDSLFAMNAETSTAVIVIIAVTSITTIGAIFFIKRRKYN